MTPDIWTQGGVGTALVGAALFWAREKIAENNRLRSERNAEQKAREALQLAHIESDRKAADALSDQRVLAERLTVMVEMLQAEVKRLTGTVS